MDLTGAAPINAACVSERDRLGPQGQAARQMILEKHTLARTVDWMTNRLHVITRSDQSENLDLVRPASAELRDVHAPCGPASLCGLVIAGMMSEFCELPITNCAVYG